MNLKKYFDEHQGFGVLSTADQDGRVNAAVYARPSCFDDGTVAFIMPDRLTHSNLQSNAHASYLFRQDAAADGRLGLGARAAGAGRAEQHAVGILTLAFQGHHAGQVAGRDAPGLQFGRLGQGLLAGAGGQLACFGFAVADVVDGDGLRRRGAELHTRRFTRLPRR